ncbi:1-acyl-sn-glycerol-3-phosphate acyltransferase [Robiginitalea sp. M366]|uniref:1-acyl-sn-glycerol-3-phosphate acyltransferase n=1 Tax=Robiginitalea aestuariiviva TaxID=3036903 RepID=UPI00240D7644|nr:1-acyl-sn-glycerol-3-phosphate acyltransferase [Robiginitalea aestuariiviva]MDG1572627.1 1-acyl-sn-glycerol-3-phosphate acyltransferase [Robiginitalea aestuariiviva]
MKALASLIYYKLMGWKLVGRFPDLDQCVVAVVPHTSWMDFALGLIVRKLIGKDIHYIGKAALFRPPYGWFFRWTGGAPVDRSGGKDNVKAAAAVFRQHKVFRLALAPEGTRKKVDRWRTGFYYIALEAGVPIVLVAFDFGRKQVKISEPMVPTGNFEADYATYLDFFKGVKGYIPEKGSY